MYPQGVVKEKVNELWDKMWPQLKAYIDKTIPVEKEKVLSNIEKMRNNHLKSSSKKTLTA